MVSDWLYIRIHKIWWIQVNKITKLIDKGREKKYYKSVPKPCRLEKYNFLRIKKNVWHKLNFSLHYTPLGPDPDSGSRDECWSDQMFSTPLHFHLSSEPTVPEAPARGQQACLVLQRFLSTPLPNISPISMILPRNLWQQTPQTPQFWLGKGDFILAVEEYQCPGNLLLCGWRRFPGDGLKQISIGRVAPPKIHVFTSSLGKKWRFRDKKWGGKGEKKIWNCIQTG